MGGRSGVGSRRGRGVLGTSRRFGASGTHGRTETSDFCLRGDEVLLDLFEGELVFDGELAG
jgi:hypothetical protein